MKKLLITAIAALACTTTMATAFSFPAHEPNGFRDTGCDEEQRVEIRNDAGELLYVNNPSCPEPQDGGSDFPRIDDEDGGDGDGGDGDGGDGDGGDGDGGDGDGGDGDGGDGDGGDGDGGDGDGGDHK